MDEASRLISGAIGEQQAATREIARSSASAARHSQDTLQHFQSIEKSVQGSGTTIARLDDECERLGQANIRLENELDRLLAGFVVPRVPAPVQDAA